MFFLKQRQTVSLASLFLSLSLLIIGYGEDSLAPRGSAQIVIHKITLCKDGKDRAIFGNIFIL